MTPPTGVATLASRLADLLEDPVSLFTTLVGLLVVWYAWSRVTADPDLDRAKRVYEERRSERDEEGHGKGDGERNGG
ncbi:hypothetical protein ACFO0N_13600 [Halobium salinum]|uniref:Uncharacterized protein n=1 Tax=Halobium salinum TaxID=1364940 RepID=A0ABD5PE49_9EURY|nr:hypothetical protein [Halobium salinum]